jgi:hypothetical protein
MVVFFFYTSAGFLGSGSGSDPDLGPLRVCPGLSEACHLGRDSSDGASE